MPNLALFDFDGTITDQDTFTQFVYRVVDAKNLRKGRLRLAPYVIGYKLGIVSGAAIRSKILKLGLTGMPEYTLREQGQIYAENQIPKMLRVNAMQCLTWHRDQGNHIVIVSASMDAYLQPWCKANGLELICSEVEYKNGVATGRYVQGDCSGKHKKQRVLAQYDLSQFTEIYVYGDTPEDFDLLSLGTVKNYRWKPYR